MVNDQNNKKNHNNLQNNLGININNNYKPFNTINYDFNNNSIQNKGAFNDFSLNINQNDLKRKIVHNNSENKIKLHFNHKNISNNNNLDSNIALDFSKNNFNAEIPEYLKHTIKSRKEYEKLILKEFEKKINNSKKKLFYY